jgi:hypothetical protein
LYRVLGADQKEYGPVSEEQIRQWIAERRLNAQSLVMGEGAVAWKPLSTYPEFASVFSAQLQAQPAPMGQPNLPPAGPSYAQGPQTTNTFALVGMIMGIVSMVFCCCSGFPFNVLGLLFSILGLNQIKSRHPAEKGKEMAIAGIILSALSLILGVLYFVFGAATRLPDLLKQMKGNL